MEVYGKNWRDEKELTDFITDIIICILKNLPDFCARKDIKQENSLKELFFDKKLLTEKQLLKFQLKYGSAFNLRLKSGCLITPLAKDYLKEHQIRVFISDSE